MAIEDWKESLGIQVNKKRRGGGEKIIIEGADQGEFYRGAKSIHRNLKEQFVPQSNFP